MTDTTGRYAPMPPKRYITYRDATISVGHSDDDMRAFADATCALRSTQEAGWLAELRRLANLYGSACIHSLTSGSDEAVADEDVRLNTLMAHAAQRPPEPAQAVPPDAESHEACGLAWQLYLRNLNGAPLSAPDAFRAAWFRAIASRQVPPISDAQILAAVRPLYADDKAAEMGAQMELSSARAVIALRDAQWSKT